LVQSLGVKKLVIVVNKMDESTVKWSKGRWDEIQNGLLPFLHNIGYRDEDLFWVPISGLRGDNITERSDACNWYDGPPLMEILDKLPIIERDANAPLRFPVLDKVKEQSKVSVIGKVE
jgi:peptide chain release factor subunit 3